MGKNNLVYRFFSEKSVNEIKHKLLLLNNPKYEALKYLSNKFFIITLGIILILIYVDSAYITAPIFYVLLNYSIDWIVIEKPIIDRAERLDNDALIFFEVFALSLESGKNLENALEVTVSNVDNELSKEFSKVLTEIRFGKSTVEALNDLRDRMPSESISNIILNMTQTSLFGNKIIDTMNNQVDFLREKKILTAKKKINKLPNQISIISVLFIVPLILLLVLGPFLIGFLTN